MTCGTYCTVVYCCTGTHRRPGLEAVHEGEHLGHDTPLHLSVRLVTLGGDGVDLVDKDDRRGVLLRLFPPPKAAFIHAFAHSLLHAAPVRWLSYGFV